MFYLVSYLFIITTSAVNCMARFVSEMACYVSSGTFKISN